MARTSAGISEIDETDLDPAEFQHVPRQRSARTDASMRDGDSAHGNPEENPEDEFSIDNDIGDTENDERGTADLLERIPDRHGADGIDPDAEPDDDDGEDSPALMRRSEEESRTPLASRRLPRETPTGGEAVEVTAERNGAAMPLDGYDKLTIPEIATRAESLSAEAIGELLSYEAANRNRKTLATRLNRLLKSGPTGRHSEADSD